MFSVRVEVIISVILSLKQCRNNPLVLKLKLCLKKMFHDIISRNIYYTYTIWTWLLFV